MHYYSRPLAVLFSFSFALVFLVACASVGRTINPAEQIRPGDVIKLNQRLTIPANMASVVLQNGQQQNGASIDRFRASCRFVMHEIAKQQQILNPAEFTVTQVSYWKDIKTFGYGNMLSGPEFINYETTIRLHSDTQTAVHSLVCQHDDEDDDGRHVWLSEMQQALGTVARIIKRSP